MSPGGIGGNTGPGYQLNNYNSNIDYPMNNRQSLNIPQNNNKFIINTNGINNRSF